MRFQTLEENELFGNDTFGHYFAEDELVKMKEKEEEECTEDQEGESDATIAFDGLSCTAFKLDKLKMGEQAKRIAKFDCDNDVKLST